MNWTPTDLAHQLERARAHGLLAPIAAAARASSIGVPFYVAIASRETNIKNMLGDVIKGRAHGVGPTQIDVQHPIALNMRDTGEWQTPRGMAALLAFGANLLADDMVYVRGRIAGLDGPTIARIAAAGYNCGISRAVESYRTSGDPDTHTTGHNYGRDVLARQAFFETLLAKEPV